MKKNIFVASILTAIMTVPVMAHSANNNVVKLDVNRDGAINAVDASIVLSEYAMTSIGKSSELNQTEKYIADYDNNGVINAIDASGVLETYAHNSISDKAYPLTKITFSVQIRVDNDIPNSSSQTTYEDCLEWIKQDRANRKLGWNQEGMYSITKGEYTVGSPIGGGQWVVYEEKF